MEICFIRLEREGEEYRIVWPRAGDEMGFLGNLMKKHPDDYSQVLSNYLNQAFKDIEG